MDDNSEAVGIASTSESMEDVLQLSNRFCSAGDRLKMCCRPTYQARKLKNKGALLILVWNCLVMSVFYYLTAYPPTFHPTSYHIVLHGDSLCQ